MFFSSSISVHGDGDLIKGLNLVLGSLVFDHVSPDSLLLGLRHGLGLHVVVKEVVKSRDLINESEIVEGEGLSPVLVRGGDSFKYLGSLFIHVNYEVFQLLLVHFKMFHDQVVRQTVSLVKVLPIVHQMVRVTVNDSVHVHTVHVHRDEEQYGKTGTCVD